MSATLSLVFIRFVFGWLFVFAGLEKILNPAWTSQGFLLHAQTFPAFYAWFAQPVNLIWVDPLNAWGIFFIGMALILGVCVRIAAWAGAALMLLYYFPSVAFPYTEHGFIVESHIIYAAVLVFIALFPPAWRFGLGDMLRKTNLGHTRLIKGVL